MDDIKNVIKMERVKSITFAAADVSARIMKTESIIIINFECRLKYNISITLHRLT